MMASSSQGLTTSIHVVVFNSISLVTSKPIRIVIQLALASSSG